MAVKSNAALKQPPDETFIGLARGVYWGSVSSPSDDELKAVNNRWREVVRELARQGNDKEAFWKVWDSLSVDRPKMKEWRRLIEIAPVAQQDAKDIPHVYHGTLLSDVTPEKVRWLWKYRLALGKITMIDGDPGLGKSLIGADLAARITTGRDMPDGTPCLEPGGVVVIMPEDGLEDTLQPRFQRAGAVLKKVSSLSEITVTDQEGKTYKRPFSLSEDLPLLEQEIKRVNAKLIYIDPLMAIIGGEKNTYKDNEVRSLLAPLKSLIEQCKVSCVLVRHLTKSRGDNPLMAGNGSVAFVGLARTSMMVTRNPEDESQAILSLIKSNIGNDQLPGLVYRVVSDEDAGDERPYIIWEGTSELSGSDLIAPPRKNTGGNRHAILEALQTHARENPGEPEMTIQQLLEALPDMTMGNMKMTLKRMYDKGEIDKSERGEYRAK